MGSDLGDHPRNRDGNFVRRSFLAFQRSKLRFGVVVAEMVLLFIKITAACVMRGSHPKLQLPRSCV